MINGKKVGPELQIPHESFGLRGWAEMVEQEDVESHVIVHAIHES